MVNFWGYGGVRPAQDVITKDLCTYKMLSFARNEVFAIMTAGGAAGCDLASREHAGHQETPGRAAPSPDRRP